MTSHSTVLITGASRGIGKGLVAVYLANPNTTVIASTRDTSSADSLHSLHKAPGSQLVIIELDVASTESIKSGITSLTAEHGIASLDVVVANAAIASLTHTTLAEIEIFKIQDYVNVNAYAQLELFRAVLPLLRKSENKAKFVYVSSAGGSLTGMSNVVPIVAYGASKALGNFLFKWLALEIDDVLIWAQHPGMVLTENAKGEMEVLKKQGIDLSAHAISVEQSTLGMKKVIEDATLENTHGRFLGPDGSQLSW